MKIFPKKIGMWIWQIPKCEGGDWNKIIDKCYHAGIGWVAIKSGDADRNTQFNTNNAKKIIDICHRNNIQVYTWNYSKPNTWKREIIQIKSLFDDGIDGHIIDAEAEWQMTSNNKELALQFLTGLRKEVGDVFIAHAPFPIVEYHIKFPYVEFGMYCDTVMPQSYWTEIGWTFQKTMDKTDAAWNNFNKQHPEAARQVYPIGVTYGKGYPNVPGELKAEDIVSFINRYPDIPISFYSYDASKSFSFFWEILTKIEDSKKKLPEPQPSPIIIDNSERDIVIDPIADQPIPVPTGFWYALCEFLSKIFGIK